MSNDLRTRFQLQPAGPNVVDAFIVGTYLFAMLLVGWHSRGQSAESFWVAQRQYGTGRITISLVATIFGASSTIGIIGMGYSRGLTAAWWSLIGATALLPFALVLAARVRSLNVYTLPDILKKAFGNQVAVPAAIMIVIAWCGIVAAQMIAAARLLSSISSLDFSSLLTVVAAVFILYTFWGGQLSVIRTDSWQLALFLGGLLTCFAVVALADQGAPLSGFAAAPSEHLRFPISEQFGWYDLMIFYPLVVGLPYLVGPDIYSRVFCARDDVVARRSVLFAAAAVIPISFFLALLGILIRAQYPNLAPEAALPTALGELVPVGLTGLIAAGFLAAIMSSADTTLISASTILSLNVAGACKPMSRPRQLVLTKVALIGVGLAAWLIAGFQQEIIASLLLGYTVFVGGVVFPTLASLYRGRLGITSTGAMWAVVVGGTTAILGEMHGGDLLRALLGSSGNALLGRVLGPRYPSILPIVLCLIVMLVVSRITRSSQSE